MHKRRRFSHPLLPGMTIGLIAPSSPVFEADRRDAAVRLLEDMGFAVRRGQSVDALSYCFSGTDEVRASDVIDMFADPEVDAVVCLRGGYGATRILDRIDWQRLSCHPKPFVGFSDITSLHVALQKHCGFITFHGPMPGVMEPIGLRDELSRAQWLSVLAGDSGRQVQNPDGTLFQGNHRGTVVGRLIGGNLSVLCSLIGTRHEPDWDQALLLLEDVSERTARLDSMVQQLESHGVFTRIAGLVLGDFSNYEGQTNPHKVPMEDIFPPHTPSELPVLWGLHAGHGRDRMTLALNARYRMDTDHATLTLLEQVFR